MSLDSQSSKTASSSRRRLDQFGIGMAGLCAVHCVATILLVSGLGIGGHFLLAHEIHHVGLILAIIVAALAIGWGAYHHRRAKPVIVASIGLAFMAAGILVGHGTEEAVLTIIGVVLVSIGHIINMRSTH